MPKIALLLTEGFADWECALLIASARTHMGMAVSITTPAGLAVTSMGGMKVAPDRAFEELEPGSADALVLCGGLIWESEAAPDVTAALQAHHAAGTVIAGICAGTIALARAGLLDGRAHTSNSPGTLAVASYAGQRFYRDQPQACRDGGIVTAPGTAPLTFTAEVLAALGQDAPEIKGYLSLFGREMAGLQPLSAEA